MGGWPSLFLFYFGRAPTPRGGTTRGSGADRYKQIISDCGRRLARPQHSWRSQKPIRKCIQNALVHWFKFKKVLVNIFCSKLRNSGGTFEIWKT